MITHDYKTEETHFFFKISRAVESDSRDIWEWRNDPITKANSKIVDSISWESHTSWYQNCLQNPDIFLYIGVDSNSNKVGICRFDVFENHAEVSINLNPQFRNKKLSKKFLDSSITQFRKSSNITLEATIKQSNIFSQQCFLKSGFRHIREDVDYKYYRCDSESHSDESKLKLIDEIESIRSNNNLNWMNLLRLSFKVAPTEAKLLFRKINADDQRISELFSKLAE